MYGVVSMVEAVSHLQSLIPLVSKVDVVRSYLTTSAKVRQQKFDVKKKITSAIFFSITIPCFAPLVPYVKITVWNPSKIRRIDVKYLKKMSSKLNENILLTESDVTSLYP